MGNKECVICGLFYSALEWSTHRSGLELAVHVSALWCLLLGTMEILRPMCLLKTGDECTWAFWRQLGSYTVCSKLQGESKIYEGADAMLQAQDYISLLVYMFSDSTK